MYRLIQEDYTDDPWRVLVCCILLNRTTGTAVRDTLPILFERWPTAVDMAHANPLAVLDVVKHLGFGERRSWYLVDMSRRFCTAMTETGGDLRRLTVWSLPGCGRYADDCWQLLVMKRRPSHGVTDKELRKYMAREGLL